MKQDHHLAVVQLVVVLLLVDIAVTQQPQQQHQQQRTFVEWYQSKSCGNAWVGGDAPHFTDSYGYTWHNPNAVTHLDRVHSSVRMACDALVVCT